MLQAQRVLRTAPGSGRPSSGPWSAMPHLPETLFDKVLVDAPCSGAGGPSAASGRKMTKGEKIVAEPTNGPEEHPGELRHAPETGRRAGLCDLHDGARGERGPYQGIHRLTAW